MNETTITIEKLFSSSPPYDLLLLADPSKEIINQYLLEGKCYIVRLEEEIIGALVLLKTDGHTLEIKNIAIDPKFQGQGYGKQLLKYAEETAKQESYRNLFIGTGNSSIFQFVLYQKMGFEVDHLKKNFFVENYEEPIVENGIACRHMVMLVKNL